MQNALLRLALLFPLLLAACGTTSSLTPESGELRTQAIPDGGRHTVFVIDGQQWCDLLFDRRKLRADFAGEARDDLVLAPLGTLAQRRHRGARFLALAHALERFVILVFQQRIVTACLRDIVEQIAAENTDQSRLRHEWRQRQENEMAFRTHTAPAVDRALAENMEIAVAA